MLQHPAASGQPRRDLGATGDLTLQQDPSDPQLPNPVGNPRIRKIDAALTIGVSGEKASVSPSVTLARVVRFTTITSPCRSGGLVGLLRTALGLKLITETVGSPSPSTRISSTVLSLPRRVIPPDAKIAWDKGAFEGTSCTPGLTTSPTTFTRMVVGAKFEAAVVIRSAFSTPSLSCRRMLSPS